MVKYAPPIHAETLRIVVFPPQVTTRILSSFSGGFSLEFAFRLCALLRTILQQEISPQPAKEIGRYRDDAAGLKRGKVLDSHTLWTFKFVERIRMKHPC